MVVHAAANSATGTTPGTYAVVLTAPNEKELLQLERKLQRFSVPHAAFREPDYNNELMSIGIEPAERCMVRHFLKGLSLLGESHDMERR